MVRTVDFAFTDEQIAIRNTARAFMADEILTREADALRRERGGEPAITRAELRDLQLAARKFGFWGLSTPREYGGMDLPAVTQTLIWIETGRSFIPFRFGGEADNILYYANAEQQAEYLVPTIDGDRLSCFAITEPNAGSDAANIKTSARRDGDDWLINGEKTFITGGNDADFAIVIAVSDPDKGARDGSTAFLVDRAMGWTSHFIPTMGEGGPATLVFDDVRVPGRNVLGEVGQGFTLGMEWIGRGRYLIPARALGAAERLLQMAIDYANTRETFGRRSASNQAIQWMIADSEVELEAADGWCCTRRGRSTRDGTPATPRRWPSSPAPRWPTASSTACCRSTAAWAIPGSCRSSAGTARFGCGASSRAPTRYSG